MSEHAATESRPIKATGTRRVVLAYVLFAALWIVASDAIVVWLFGDPAGRAWVGLLKGAVFVAATSAWLYALLKVLLRRQALAFERERQAVKAEGDTWKLMQTLADSSPDAIFAKDLAGRYTLVNREAARATGVAAEALIGKDDRAAFAPAQAETIRADDRRVIAQDHPESFEEELDTVQGRLTYLTTKGPLRDRQGRVIGLFGISRDITERQQAQRKLQDSERQYRLLFESNPHPMVLVDAQNRKFLAVNEAALAKYGFSREEFAQLTLDDMHTPASRARLGAVLDDGLVSALPAAQLVAQWQHQCKDGRAIDVEVTSSLVDYQGRAALLGLAHDITERLALERQTRENQARAEAAHEQLRKVLARVRDGFVALDRDWNYTFLNRQAAKFLGRERPEDLLGRNIWVEFPEVRGQPFHLAYERALATQQPELFEDHYAPWDRWFENRVYPSDEGLSIYFTDITERKRAEVALRLSEQRYRLAAAQGEVWDWDELSRHLHIAPEFWERLGYEPSAPGDALSELERRMHPEDVGRRRLALQRHLTHHEPYDVEFRVQHANGSWRWFHTRGQAVWNPQGRGTFMAGTTVDITLRKSAEEAQRQAEAYLRSLFEQLSDGVVLHGPGLEILDVNPHALALLGYSREEILKLKATDLLVEFERARLLATVGTMGPTELRLAEWEVLRRDGSHFPAEISARKLDGTRTLAVLRDISARREAQSSLVAHQLELSELTQQLLNQERQTMQRVAQSLHDRLGQTLAVARLNLDATIASAAPLLTDELKQQCQRQAALIDQAVLEVRHVLQDLRPPLLEEQGLASALDNEIRLRLAQADGTDLLLEVDDPLAEQRWPPDVEYGAFMVAREAITNACRHARASLVRVALHGSPVSLQLEVTDDGAGIAAPLMRGRPGHLGIVGMRERALAIGAEFAIAPHAEQGTTVSLRWRARVA